MLTTPITFRLNWRFPFSGWKRPAFWGAHLTACLMTALVASAWAALWEVLLNPYAVSPGPDPFMQVWGRKFYGGMLSYIVLYGLILLVAHIAESQRRMALQQAETARVNEQLSKAQLNALRRQIEPHFLFNTLNAITGLVREGRNDTAVSMIAELSDFLRRVVNKSDRHQVPLAEELEFTKKYLEIQKLRFAERLEFALDVPEELMSAQVPSLILQPIVENAIKHGIAQRVKGGTIGISAARSNGTLTLRVSNEGPSLPADWEQTASGIGVQNVRTRLQAQYGNAFKLELHNQRSGVEALVAIPYVASDPTPASNAETGFGEAQHQFARDPSLRLKNASAQDDAK